MSETSSLPSLLSSLSAKQRTLAGLKTVELSTLLWDWKTWARRSQLEPPGDWLIWLIRRGLELKLDR
jgi:hypothetical protein